MSNEMNETAQPKETSADVKRIEVHVHLSDGSTTVQPLEYLLGVGIESQEGNGINLACMQYGSASSYGILMAKKELLSNITPSDLMMMQIAGEFTREVTETKLEGTK